MTHIMSAYVFSVASSVAERINKTMNNVIVKGIMNLCRNYFLYDFAVNRLYIFAKLATKFHIGICKYPIIMFIMTGKVQ